MFWKILKNCDSLNIWDLLNSYNSPSTLDKMQESFVLLNTRTKENSVQIFCFRFS